MFSNCDGFHLLYIGAGFTVVLGAWCAFWIASDAWDWLKRRWRI